MRKEIRLSGFGCQGLALAGQILGKAVALYSGMEAVMTQSYGPEARGGASGSNIVVADRAIDYPFIQQADVLVALSQEAYARYRPEARKDAIVIIDQDLVTPSKSDHPYTIPATRMAEELGRRIVANMVMLGYMTAVTGIATRQAMEKAIKATVPEKTVPLNLKAFALGYEYAPGKEQAA